MDLTKFINSHEELKELPFLVVYRVLQILRDKGLLNV